MLIQAGDEAIDHQVKNTEADQAKGTRRVLFPPSNESSPELPGRLSNSLSI